MTGDLFIRRVLWASAAFNLMGALLFAFPAHPLGRVAGLPSDVPALYRATVFLFVTLFAGSYAWIASQPEINRPMLAYGAIGKASFFALVVLFWVFAGVPGRAVIVASGDAVLAAIFAQWLVRNRAAS